jgi:hypothetical protein
MKDLEKSLQRQIANDLKKLNFRGSQIYSAASGKGKSITIDEFLKNTKYQNAYAERQKVINETLPKSQNKRLQLVQSEAKKGNFLSSDAEKFLYKTGDTPKNYQQKESAKISEGLHYEGENDFIRANIQKAIDSGNAYNKIYFKDEEGNIKEYEGEEASAIIKKMNSYKGYFNFTSVEEQDGATGAKTLTIEVTKI